MNASVRVCVCVCVCVGIVRLSIHAYIYVVRTCVECVRVCVWCVSSFCYESCLKLMTDAEWKQTSRHLAVAAVAHLAVAAVAQPST